MNIDLPAVGEPFELTLDEVPVTEIDDIFRALILDLVEHDRWDDLAELRENLRESGDTVAWANPYFDLADLLSHKNKDELTPEKLNHFLEETYLFHGWVYCQVNRVLGELIFPENPPAKVSSPIPRNLNGKYLNIQITRGEYFFAQKLLEKYFPSFLRDHEQS